MNILKRKELFSTPSAEYQGKPFWSWNGKLNAEELQRQVDIMKNMGFGGFFMHSRTGLETEYLGNEWFALTNICADYGKQQGMEAWLYDEDRWPSGIAGGIVTKEQKYRSMFLEMFQYTSSTVASYEWDEQVVSSFVCRLSDVIFTDERPWKQGDPLSNEETVVIFKVRYSECKDVYNGYTYLDTMNLEGVEKYIEVTHEEYAKQCGDRPGDSIKGIFTDEPHRGAMFSTFSEGRENCVPYTPLLFQEFEKRFEYDLKEYLLELFLLKDGQRVSKVTRDYIELCQELFIENFAMPIQKWCHDHNIKFTGHVLHEDSLTAQTVMQGSLMRFYEYMDYPGIDILAEKNECWWVVKQVVSVARQLNKEWILSELYGCTGWQMSFEAYKNIGDWQALFGINLRCPHLSWYTMKGEAKRDYPASILHQSAWHEEYQYLEDYFSRIHVALSKGTPDCQLLVINPIESVWARSYSSAFDGLSPRDIEISNLEKKYQEVFYSLAENRIDFDYGEEDIISRHGRIEKGLLYVGQSAYRKVLVAGMDTIRNSTLTLLTEFLQQGGEIIFAGEAPGYVDTVPSAKAMKLAKQACCIPFNKVSIAKFCRSGNEVSIQGKHKKDIFAQVRLVEEGKAIMLLNMNRGSARKCLSICLGQGECIEEWNAKTGHISFVNSEKKKGKLYITVDFERGEEKLFVVRDKGSESGRMDTIETSANIITPDSMITPVNMITPANMITPDNIITPDKYKYTLSEENICVLDFVKITTDRGECIEEKEVVKADRELRDLMQIPYRSGEMLQPWFEIKYNNGTKTILREISLEYRVDIDRIPENIKLVLEDLEHIKGITVNGISVSMDVMGKWIDICFDKIQIPKETLEVGCNSISIQYDYYKTGGIEAIYLIGDFGVRFNEFEKPVITVLPEYLEIGDITYQGLPFYSGKVSYLLEEGKKKITEVEIQEFEGACVKLIGKDETLLAWPPFKGIVHELEEIQVILTRRNTFGPLHALPARALAYGPNNYLTTGNSWSDSYVLLPQGLMKKPKICTKRMSLD